MSSTSQRLVDRLISPRFIILKVIVVKRVSRFDRSLTRLKAQETVESLLFMNGLLMIQNLFMHVVVLVSVLSVLTGTQQLDN